MARTALIALALTGLAGVTLVGWLALGLDAARGQRWLLYLRKVPVPAGLARAGLPTVSIVFAARDEARGVAAAVRAMLALDYPQLEVVAVDDRSTDGTGAILDELAGGDERLQVLHIAALPEGWLGKNHALWRGAQAAAGEFLLFTDADVVFEPTVVARAVAAMEEGELDHVAAATDIEAHGLGLQLFVATFALFFNAYFRPWRAGDPASRCYAGFGGFNLMRRAAYTRAGTHAALPLDPLDDINLGKLLKATGSRQVCAIPEQMARVEWYESLGGAIRGLEKNTMAGVNWSFSLLLAGVAGQLLLAVWPFVAVLVLDGPARWLNLAAAAALMTLQGGMLSATSLPRWLPLFLPVGVLLVVWTTLRAAFLTFWRGGIRWRGTFYSLAELRRGDP